MTKRNFVPPPLLLVSLWLTKMLTWNRWGPCHQLVRGFHLPLLSSFVCAFFPCFISFLFILLVRMLTLYRCDIRLSFMCILNVSFSTKMYLFSLLIFLHFHFFFAFCFVFHYPSEFSFQFLCHFVIFLNFFSFALLYFPFFTLLPPEQHQYQPCFERQVACFHGQFLPDSRLPNCLVMCLCQVL